MYIRETVDIANTTTKTVSLAIYEQQESDVGKMAIATHSDDRTKGGQPKWVDNTKADVYKVMDVLPVSSALPPSTASPLHTVVNQDC